MRSFNKSIIGGRLGQDPEIRYSTQGTKIANVSVACNYSYKKNDEWEEATDWIRCTAFGYVADKIEKCKKGDFILIEGSLKTRSWEDDEGNKRSITYVNIKDVLYMPSFNNKNNEEDDAQSPEVLDEDDVPF